jgi:UDP-perosamine 4-acetyltransferase
MKKPIRPCIVWGATGQSEVVYDILLYEGTPLVHLFDNDINMISPLPGVPIAFGEDGLHSFIATIKTQGLEPADIDCVAAIGGSNGHARESITKLMESYGFISRKVLHKSAVISPLAKLGRSVQIMAGSIIGPFASIGDFTMINSGANVDHSCVIGQSCHLAPRAALAGEVVVEDSVFIGINATVLPRLRIGKGATVGAGAVVTRDVPNGTVVAGNPARPILR